MKILVLEPYYGGSHRAFLKGLQHHLDHDFELLTLPARKWKWRMRLAAPWLAGQLEPGRRFDRILCSTFVDVAAFRALAPAWAREVPLCTYFHENQFVYPVQQEDERDLHFALTNYTTALASDRLAFNSAYNLHTFLAGAAALLKIAPDMDLTGSLEEIRAKAVILPPGLDFGPLDQAGPATKSRPGGTAAPPVIVWNHRWEHDKDPETFFRTLFELDRQGVAFRLVVLGQSFARRPEIFHEAKTRLAHRLLHWGYAQSREEYHDWLRQGDVVVSTARHEFFGLAVIEAVRAGCRPLLPNRLSYPELFPADYLYEEGELAARLTELLQGLESRGGESRGDERLPPAAARRLTDRFAWENLAARYEAWLG